MKAKIGIRSQFSQILHHRRFPFRIEKLMSMFAIIYNNVFVRILAWEFRVGEKRLDESLFFIKKNLIFKKIDDEFDGIDVNFLNYHIRYKK